MRGNRREVLASATVWGLVLSPWLAWLAVVRDDTQVGLVPVRGLASTVASNGVFYAQRLIDQILGPVVEVATVFASRFSLSGRAATAISIAATLAGAVACVPITIGWVRLAKHPRSRAAGLVPAFTMAMLLAWPFTEAGRFLVPLVPFLIAGLAEGLAAILGCLGVRKSRTRAALVVLAASLPYSLYAIASRRADAERRTHRDFDAACAWIAGQRARPGPVLSRHPGEVFLSTGRTGLPIDRANIDGAAFVLSDDERFAHGPTEPAPARPRSRPRALGGCRAVG